MDRTTAERLSVRAAMALGVGVTISLWLYTGSAFSSEISTVRADADAAAARYNQAQQLLTTIRTQALLMSVRVRDAILARQPAVVAEDRELIEESYRVIAMALEDYEPVARTTDEGQQVALLKDEFDRFHDAALNVLQQAAGRPPETIREVLERNLMPRREAALFMSDAIQTLNREAYIGQQHTIAAIYQAAESRSRWQLGVALGVSLVVLLLTYVYAGRLDRRLGMQLKRDVGLAKALHDTSTKLIAAQALLAQSDLDPEGGGHRRD